MLAAGTKVKISGSEEKKANRNTYDISKQRQRNVQKSVLHVQSCFFFLIRLFFFALLVAVAVSGDVTRDDLQDDF